jgi:hypothetical protein
LKGFSDSLSSPTTGEGGNHGCEGDFDKEVCCEAERRGTRIETLIRKGKSPAREEAKLIALACSKPPKRRARWTLRLLETKVVELGIVDRASDSTIGRALKKTLFSPIAASTGSSRRRPNMKLLGSDTTKRGAHS